MSREVVPGHPYHVTQQDNQCLATFIQDGDCWFYKCSLSKEFHKVNERFSVPVVNSVYGVNWHRNCSFQEIAGYLKFCFSDVK